MTTMTLAALSMPVPPPRAEDTLATLCHDLRTPLTVILGTAQLLAWQVAQNRADHDALAEGLARIELAAQRMAALLDELLDLSLQDAGRPPALNLQPVELVALARRVADEQRTIADGRTIAVLAATADVVGMWDEARLGRVLANLLSNALKYSPDGGEIVVGVRRIDAATGGAWAELTVRDHGVGIPAADLPHVFDSFHRGANVVGRVDGSGLGLASVRAIVEHHGGTVAIDSVEGEGTTVTVRLPLCRSTDEDTSHA